LARLISSCSKPLIEKISEPKMSRTAMPEPNNRTYIYVKLDTPKSVDLKYIGAKHVADCDARA